MKHTKSVMLVLAGLSLTACGQPGSFDSVEDIRTAIEKSGVDCPASEPELVQEGTYGRCGEINYILHDSEEQARTLQQEARASGYAGLFMLAGDTWSIMIHGEGEQAERIAKAVGVDSEKLGG